MKAIIVAAGRGRRLGPETDDIPKCMVAVGGRPILHRQLEALAAAGADEVVIVRGYLGDKIQIPPPPPGLRLRFIENPGWQTNNILASLFHAEAEMDSGFLFTYSDIVFGGEHALRVAASPADVALVVDRRWQEAYVGRLLHPVSEAELVKVEDGVGDAAGDGAAVGPRVRRVGKRVVAADEAAGEFTGLAKFSARGAAGLRRVWAAALGRGLEHPFGEAAALRQAYLSDALNQMAAEGVPLVPVFVDGRWREIDTEEDLARAHALVDRWE
jgi:phosphoenolpyruvate phosphomutase